MAATTARLARAAAVVEPAPAPTARGRNRLNAAALHAADDAARTSTRSDARRPCSDIGIERGSDGPPQATRCCCWGRSGQGRQRVAATALTLPIRARPSPPPPAARAATAVGHALEQALTEPAPLAHAAQPLLLRELDKADG